MLQICSVHYSSLREQPWPWNISSDGIESTFFKFVDFGIAEMYFIGILLLNNIDPVE